MIRNKSLGKRLLAAGIMLIFSMSGCGTDNEIELTGNGIGSDGIEAVATVDSAEVRKTWQKQLQSLPSAQSRNRKTRNN